MALISLLPSINEGIRQNDAAERQRRLENLELFEKYRSLAQSMGRDISIPEMEKQIEELTGGDNYAGGLLPRGQALRTVIDNHNRMAAQQRIAAQTAQMQAEQQQRDLFQQQVFRVLTEEEDNDKAVEKLNSMFSDPEQQKVLQTFLSGMDLNDQRNKLYDEQALEFFKSLPDTMTADEAYAWTKSRSPKIADRVKQLAHGRDRQKYDERRAAALATGMQMAASNPEFARMVVEEPNNPAIQAMFPGVAIKDIIPTLTLHAQATVRGVVRKNRNDMIDTVLQDQAVLGAMSHFDDSSPELHRMLEVYGRRFEQPITADLVAEIRQQAEAREYATSIQQVAATRTSAQGEALKAADSLVDESQKNASALASVMGKEDPRVLRLAGLQGRYYSPNWQLVIDSMDPDDGTLDPQAEQALQASGMLVPVQEFRARYTADYVEQNAAPAVEPWDIVQQKADAKIRDWSGFEAQAGAAQTREGFQRLQQRAVGEIDRGILQLERMALNERAYFGFNRAEAAALIQRMRQRKDAILALPVPANLPTIAEAEAQKAAAGQAANVEAAVNEAIAAAQQAEVAETRTVEIGQARNTALLAAATRLATQLKATHGSEYWAALDRVATELAKAYPGTSVTRIRNELHNNIYRIRRTQ